MKYPILLVTVVMLMACANQSKNPFFSEYETPFKTPPFDRIKNKHYMPAIKEGIKQEQKEIDAIATNEAAPTFENTVVAMEKTGALLDRVQYVFYNMLSANTNDELQKIAKEASPLLSKHRDDILLNEKLFKRIKAVYGQKDDLDLSTEQMTLLDKYYKDFVRGGANLSEAKKAELREINKELSLLSIQFGENVLNEINKFELVIDNKADLAGLTEGIISAAAETAKEKGYDGKWVFTIQKPSLIPFLQYSDKRDLREKMFKAYINQGNHDDELDNKANVAKIVSLRVKRAKLLGYATHADFILEQNMAKEPSEVYDLLFKIWKPALKRAKEECKDLQAMIDKEGKDFELQPWDWWYYAEKLKKEKYALDDEVLRPYFRLENVRNGAFMVAKKLYGLSFEERIDLPKYNNDVKVFDVKDADGSHLGILYVDYFPRASKQGGAWMNDYLEQSDMDGKMVRPIVTNVFNFTKPTGDKPALLTFEEVETLFHEFGHGLHSLLSNVTYPRLSGTNVPRDFVELPSQIMENWAGEPAVLKIYARHYETGEPIPDELIEKIRKARFFNQGFATVEYLAAAFLDMDWHTLTDPFDGNVMAFEDTSLNHIGLIPEIVVRYRSPYFRHIFSGGYSAGYYSYIWAEVLDQDAFQAFKETSLFDQKTAHAFRKYILSKGGTEDPMELYVKFRGKKPDIKPLLRNRGLL